jgi:hypothetical protein
MLILSASFIVSGSFLFNVSGKMRENAQPINPQEPNIKNGKLSISKASL